MSAFRWTCEWARNARVRTHALSETESTNLLAKNEALAVDLVIADHQTAGRGRGDHKWNETAGQALLSSWVFKRDQAPQPILSLLIGLALYEAARQAWPSVKWALKAPNDLHVIESDGPKKIAGLLVEAVTSSAQPGSRQNTIVIGLGLNTSGAPTGTTPYPATHLTQVLTNAGLTLKESDWQKFLSFFWSALPGRIDEGLVSDLKHSTKEALEAALKLHPNYTGKYDV